MPRLRRATPSQRPLVLGLMEAFAADLAIPWDRALRSANLDDLDAHPELGGIWIIEEPDDILGYAAVTIGFSFEFGGRCMLLDELYITPASRGRGLGSWILEQLDAVALALGASTLFLEASEAPGGPAAFYQRHGFVRRPYGYFSRPVRSPV